MAKEYLGQEYATATNGKGLRQEPWYVRVITRMTITFSVIVMLISVAIIACSALLFLSPVRGTSMMTTLNATGENTNSGIICRVTGLQRGNIVVSRMYQDQTKDGTDPDAAIRYRHQDEHGRYTMIIKRLIALGGDTITMTREPNGMTNTNADYNYDYSLYVNGEKLDEPYLDPSFGKPNAYNFVQLYNMLHNLSRADTRDWLTVSFADCIQDGVLTIPDGYYFLMGDNRGGKLDTNPEYSYSWDSTKIGPLPVNQYVGTCIDIVDNNVNLAGYFWNKIVYYVFFGWAWQK